MLISLPGGGKLRLGLSWSASTWTQRDVVPASAHGWSQDSACCGRLTKKLAQNTSRGIGDSSPTHTPHGRTAWKHLLSVLHLRPRCSRMGPPGEAKVGDAPVRVLHTDPTCCHILPAHTWLLLLSTVCFRLGLTEPASISDGAVVETLPNKGPTTN